MLNEKKRQFIQKIMKNVKEAIYQSIAQLKVEALVTPEPIPFDRRFEGQYKPIEIKQTWGQLWDCGWFHLTGIVPEKAKNQMVVLLVDVNGEGCVFDEKGCPIRGLTNISSSIDPKLGNPGKRVIQWADEALGGELIDIWVETGCNDLFGEYSQQGSLEQATVAICHPELRALYYDCEVLYDLMLQLPDTSARHMRLLYQLYQAMLLLTDYTDDEARLARQVLAPELAKKGGDSSLKISAVGHAHIDLAWLWPIRETIRKGSRTFATALELTERYPDYIFGASQPQLYDWMKKSYPSLYDKIKKQVKAGRWEVQGAMWVEPDTNLSGGEALVRQILYGKRFFKKEFDKEIKVLWLPDVFGYNGALPQILKKSGVDYFMTIKLSWSEFNKFPHHTFYWQGIDGSRVLTHMPPEGNYNSPATPTAIRKAETSFLEKGLSEHCLMLFGIGDGGGGPGAEHLERLQREKDLNGLVPVVQEPAIDFFERIDQSENSANYPVWRGELYLEKHQGTLTSQATNKWYNRKMEMALRECEFMASWAMLLTDYCYPQMALEMIWKEVLLYQFHDILPGSSIKRVYVESQEAYKKLYQQTLDLTNEAQEALGQVLLSKDKTEEGVFFNSLPWDREEWRKVKGQWRKVTVPAMGYTKLTKLDVLQEVEENEGTSDSPEVLRASECCLENELLKIEFNQDGSISSIYDKEYQCQVIEQGKQANCLSVYEDDGDAWDFDIGYTDKRPTYFRLTKAIPAVEGRKLILRQSYKYGQSTLQQTVCLVSESRRIDFQTEVNWQETHKMLRTSFPLTVRAEQATCDIQFGTIRRSTHQNTSWDLARFEIAAQKWVDLSRNDYGVALLNDCKYGYKVTENVLDLNLLRSSQYPGVDADRGQHCFVYSLYPHVGNHVIGQVARQGYELNSPLQWFALPTDQSTNKATTQTITGLSEHEIIGRDGDKQNNGYQSFVELVEGNVMIEAIKKAEDERALIIRMYEQYGQAVGATLRFNYPFKRVEQVTLMEETEQICGWVNKSLPLVFQPFEIQTLKCYF